MSKKLYIGEAVVSEESRTTLKALFENHLHIYNYALDQLSKNPEIKFQLFGSLVGKYIEQEQLFPVLKPAIHNELFYQYKKFRRNVKVKREKTDIQYVTATITGYSNNSLTFEDYLMTISLLGLNCSLTVSKSLPRLEPNKLYYYNISYSSLTDSFIVTVHVSDN